MSFFDFNSAEQQPSFDLIPKGTLVRVRMGIKPGGFDDPSQGWVGGWATQSFDTGAVYLACEGVVLQGPFAKRKIWWNVGLHSAKGPTWGNMGRTFIRAALNSARNVHPADQSPQAQALRRIIGFAELDGLEFAARIDIEKDSRGEERNTIKSAIEPDHKDYALIMGQAPTGHPGAQPTPALATLPARPSHSAPAAAARPPAPSVPGGKPVWAQ